MLVKISKTRQNTLLKRGDNVQQKGRGKRKRERLLEGSEVSNEKMKKTFIYFIDQSKIIDQKAARRRAASNIFKGEATNKEYFSSESWNYMLLTKTLWIIQNPLWSENRRKTHLSRFFFLKTVTYKYVLSRFKEDRLPVVLDVGKSR